jgi:hypothetical protein
LLKSVVGDCAKASAARLPKVTSMAIHTLALHGLDEYPWLFKMFLITTPPLSSPLYRKRTVPAFAVPRRCLIKRLQYQFTVSEKSVP